MTRKERIQLLLSVHAPSLEPVLLVNVFVFAGSFENLQLLGTWIYFSLTF